MTGNPFQTRQNIPSMVPVFFDAPSSTRKPERCTLQEALDLSLVKILSSPLFTVYALTTSQSKTLTKVLEVKPRKIQKTSISLLTKSNSTIHPCSTDLKRWEKDWVLLNFITTGLSSTWIANKTFCMTLQSWNWNRTKSSRRNTFWSLILVLTSSLKKPWEQKSWFVDTRIQIEIQKKSNTNSIMKKPTAILLQCGKRKMDFSFMNSWQSMETVVVLCLSKQVRIVSKSLEFTKGMTSRRTVRQTNGNWGKGAF